MSHAFAWRPAMLAGLALVPVLGFGASPALAQSAEPDTQVRTMALHYGDLDLSTASGQAQLNARLRQTAAAVCGREPDMRSLPQAEEFRDCYNHALNEAQRTLAQKQQETRLVRR